MARKGRQPALWLTGKNRPLRFPPKPKRERLPQAPFVPRETYECLACDATHRRGETCL